MNKELDLKNCKFTYDGNKINIELKDDLIEPEKLYKYYSLSNYSLKGLKDNTMYFSHAHLLNDVMDGNFMLWDLKKFIEDYKKENNIKHEIDDELTKKIIKQINNPFLECRGVLSLSDTYKNELIWSHYTSETGYCIELDIKEFKKELSKNRDEDDYHFFPLSYGKLKQIDFLDNVIKKIVPKNRTIETVKIDAKLPILYCFAQKDKCWKYENEWRFLLKDKKFNHISFPIEIINDEEKLYEDSNKLGGNINIEKNTITKIILAPLFFNNSRFNKVEITNSKSIIYNFKKDNIVRDFLETLKNSFNDKIYQVDKVIKDNYVVREIKYKIEIVDITEGYVKLIKTECP